MFNFGGGMLTGHEIERQIKKGNITITPYDPKFINPNSINLRLHPCLKVYERDADRINLMMNTKYENPEEDRHVRIKPFDIECIAKLNEKDIDIKAAAMDVEEAKPVTDNNNGTATITVDAEGRKTEIRMLTGSAITEEIVSKTDKVVEQVNIGFDCALDYMGGKYSNAIERVRALEKYPNNESYHLSPLDMNKDYPTMDLFIPEEGLVLWPGVLYIGRTIERTATDKFIPMINGRSSVGRLGICVHITAGFGDIGFDGTWTLEITVAEPVRVYPSTEIAQVCFFKPAGRVKKLYKGRYQNQIDATASRFYKSREEAYGDET